jgi:hypothetical protein
MVTDKVVNCRVSLAPCDLPLQEVRKLSFFAAKINAFGAVGKTGSVPPVDYVLNGQGDDLPDFD